MAAPTVEFESVTLAYDRAPVVEGATLRIEPGAFVGIVGPSGAGKTTVVRLLLRLYDPDFGAVRLDGVDLRDLTLASVRSNVGVVLQETLLFDATLRENVVYGSPDVSEDEFLAVARATGLDRVAAQLPDGYDTPVGQRGRALSGGQRQRVALARTLLRDTPVVVLDEPFAGLDAASAAELLDAFDAVRRGRTMILISHDPPARRIATRIVRVSGGRLVRERDRSAQRDVAGAVR